MSQPALQDFDSIAHLLADPITRAVAAPVRPLAGVSIISTKRPKYTPRTTEGIKHLSAFRRRELCILPGMCYEAISRGRNRFDYQTERLKNLFLDAMIPAIADPDLDRATRTARKADEDALVLYLSFFDHHWDYEKIAYCLYALACDLTASGFFHLEEGSALAEALQALCDDVLPKLAPRQIASADKQAAHLLQHIQDNGYFA